MTDPEFYRLVAAVGACFLAIVLTLGGGFHWLIAKSTKKEKLGQSIIDPQLHWGKIIAYVAVGGVIGVALGSALDMPAVGLAICLGAGGFGWFQQQKEHREALFAFEDELPTLLTRWSNDMASGMAFDRAVEASFADAKPVVRPVLSAILPQLSEDPVVAFQAAQLRMERSGVYSEEFSMVVAVVSAGARAGKLGPALANLSGSLQEIENLKLQVKKETELGRRNVSIMVLAGLLIAVVINVVTPPTLQEVAPTPQSQLLFIAAITLLGGAWVAGYYLSRSKV